MGWANDQMNASLALTAGIFVAAGTLILYIINGILTFRIVKDQHHRFGETIRILVLSRFLLFGIILTLILMIVAAVQSAYTLNTKIRAVDRQLQLYGVTFYAIIAGLPLIVLLISHITANRPPSTSKIGPSRHRRRITTVVLVSVLLSVRAIWICIVTWQRPTPLTQPLEWYLNKPSFYLVSLVPELLAVMVFCFLRIDNYFWLSSDGTFDDPSKARSIGSPEPLVTPMPPPVNPNTEPKIAWTPPPIPHDVEQGFGAPQHDYSHHGGIGPRQRYPPGVKMMSPVDEDPTYASAYKAGISRNVSRESVGGQSYQYAATVVGDDMDHYPMQPKFNKRVSNGTLSIISSFPDPNMGNMGGVGGAYGRTSLAMDPSTGLYHFVSAPLVPMFSPAAMGQDPSQSMVFGESPFADPQMLSNNGSNRQSRMSNAPTLFSTTNGSQQPFASYPFPSQYVQPLQYRNGQPMQFAPAPLQFPAAPPPAVLTASNTSAASSSTSPSSNSSSSPQESSSTSSTSTAASSQTSHTPPLSLRAQSPPTTIPRKPSPLAAPLSSHPPSPVNNPTTTTQQAPPLPTQPKPAQVQPPTQYLHGTQALHRPTSIHQRRRTSSLLSRSISASDPSLHSHRQLATAPPPSLAALRLASSRRSVSADGKRRIIPSTYSTYSTNRMSMQSNGLESLVNMVSSHTGTASERAEQIRAQSQRERPGFPGSEMGRGFERTGTERPVATAARNGERCNGMSRASQEFWGRRPLTEAVTQARGQ